MKIRTTPSIAEMRHQRDELEAEARDLLDANPGGLDPEAAERFDEIAGQIDDLREQTSAAEERAEQGRRRAIDAYHGTGPGGIEHGSDRGGDRHTGGTVRDQAMRTIDRHTKSGDLPTHAAERVEHLMAAGSSASQSWVQRWTVAAGDDAYRTAFAKLCADPERGHLLWEPDEADAFRRVAHIQAEQRAAMSSADANGGYMTPLVLDPSILLISDGSTNPLRQISRVVQTTGSQWSGVTSAGTSAEWLAEAAEAADASPTLQQPNIPVHKGDAFVPYSFEVGQDAVNFLSELQTLLVDAADQLQATAFTTGTGIGQPKGIITALTGTSAEINSGGTEALTSADVYTLQNSLGPRWQPNAVWTANLSTINTLRQFETGNGALKFPSLQVNPPTLLGRAVHENSNMDGVVNPAASGSNYVLVYGDFSSNFVIVDRIGTTLELIPNLVGANRRPTGQRGALLWFRTGSDIVHPAGFKMLDVPTTA
ncbi:hypothetical protein AXA44_15445 [Rhodococcus sp. SC4]|nr:hypothetical protein AXA44_15445 [Rhodococcus sp. SC4]